MHVTARDVMDFVQGDSVKQSAASLTLGHSRWHCSVPNVCGGSEEMDLLPRLPASYGSAALVLPVCPETGSRPDSVLLPEKTLLAALRMESMLIDCSYVSGYVIGCVVMEKQCGQDGVSR